MEWYAVHTHVNKEVISEINLIRQNFITYLPKYKKIIRHARKKRTVIKPLFPRYLFVKIDLLKQRWASINSTYGVNTLISMADYPVKIPYKIINEIKSYDNSDGLADISPCSDMNIGDEVNIVDGIFSGRKAIFDGLTDDNRVKILFRLLGKELTLSMSPVGVSRY
jgi:transcriptional antiterminator RfaH